MTRTLRRYTLAILALSVIACNNGNGSPSQTLQTAETPQIVSLDPAPNALSALANVNITATFDQSINIGDVSIFVVHGSMKGRLAGTYSGGGALTLSFDSDNDFKPGEEIEVSLTTGLTTAEGTHLDTAFVYRFLSAVVNTGSNANFLSTTTVAVGDGPESIAAGDLDGDGDLDLAVANRFSDDVTVLLNDGNAGFNAAPGSPITVVANPRFIKAADLDGDGDLDLAVAETNAVNVFLNDGGGEFSRSTGSPFQTGDLTTFLTAGDLDGDGDLDLAATNQFGADVTILLNDGSGDFSESPGSPVAAGSNPVSLAAGDLDGDGDLDLAVANVNSDIITLLSNQP